MSDLAEDIEILEEIKLLEDALAQQPSTDPIDEPGDLPSQPISRSSLYTIADTLPASTPEEFLINEAFQMNESLLSKCHLLKNQILARIQEIRQEREKISSKLKLVSKAVKGIPRLTYKRFGCPYFKDEQMFGAPWNEDAHNKFKRGEGMVVYQRSPRRWTVKDRNSLWMAVRLQAATEHFEKETNKQIQRQKQSQAKTRSKTGPKTSKTNEKFNLDLEKFQLPSNYREMIGPLGSREFDWMKIAAHDSYNRHSAEECRVMWSVYLHPDVNRYKFTTPEDQDLIKSAGVHNQQDWDAIADAVGTGRSGYQCIIRYITLMGPLNLKNKDVPWTAREDQILINVVESLRVGNYIPWSHVTFYIDNRIKNQVYSHWKYNIDPSLRKGRFTTDEDELLLEGVTKYGKNFPRISTELLPHRTSVQLSGRFTLLMLKTDQSYNSWTVAEDMQLLKLYEDLGPQWSKIAGLMKKNRTYVRHRYSCITRHLAKGRDLSNIPRKRRRSGQSEEDGKIFDEMFVLDDVTEANVDVDTRLKRYFERNQVPIAPPGRNTQYFDAVELDRHTRGLHDLFDKLDVRLQIPKDLNIEGLTVKDKQLLVSFQNYSSGRGTRGIDELEIFRKKMFGEDKDKREGINFFIPPAPFGLHFKKCGKKCSKKRSDKTTDDDCTVVLDFNIETPKNVDKMLKEEEIEVFEKFSEMLSKPCARINAFEQKLLTMETEHESDLITNTAINAISWGRKMGEKTKTIEDVEGERKKFVEPRYSTLLGYETLRYMKEANGSLEWTKTERKMSKEPVSPFGKRAFHTFKTRFTRLFKYPIGIVKYAEMKVCNSNLVGALRESEAEDKEDED
ncbi:snRNA-activating protein complex subunit 4 [Diachasma alloeum]|uniref:snRNA-activating protein complex subunit 4 n=1 Tax=Diachasma alloeum TaxID=454923 RepID=UPI00073839A2|nr:snRNA-activating protein complex subunit 4 [Diachasma alloeum]